MGQEQERKALSRKTKLAVAGGVAIAAITLSGGAAYKSIESFRHNTIDSIVPGLGGGEVPTTFDNAKDEGLIGDNNMSRMSQEEIESLSGFKPKYNKETKTLEYLIPFKIPKGVTANLDKTPRVRGGVDLKAAGFKEAPKINFSDKGVEVIAPADAHIALFRGGNNNKIDPSLTEGTNIYYYDPEQDITILWGIGAIESEIDGESVGLTPLLPMTNVQDLHKEIGWEIGWQEKLPTVKAGTPIMKTVDPKQQIVINIAVRFGKDLGGPGVDFPITHFVTDERDKLITLALTP